MAGVPILGLSKWLIKIPGTTGTDAHTYIYIRYDLLFADVLLRIKTKRQSICVGQHQGTHQTVSSPNDTRQDCRLVSPNLIRFEFIESDNQITVL